jgi:DNA-binding NtrC family response regulator
MARVQLLIDDPASSLTLRAMLQAEGHVVVETMPEVAIADSVKRALESARLRPTLILARATDVHEAVATMRKGVYGYIFVPFQSGEADIMVRRAIKQERVGEPEAPLSLADAEARHILATLKRCKDNRAEAARVLGIGRNTLWRKLKNIRREAARERNI